MVYNNIYYDIVEESKIRTPNIYYPLVFSSSFFISPIISAITKQLWHFVLLAIFLLAGYPYLSCWACSWASLSSNVRLACRFTLSVGIKEEVILAITKLLYL